MWPARAAFRSGLAKPPARPEPSRARTPGLGWRHARRVEVLLCALAVTLVAGCNFLVGLGEPRGPVWDESYYLTTTQRYLEGEAQFASHPPLGLMLIAGGEALSGRNARLDTHVLARTKQVSGDMIPAGYDFAGVRMASGLSGVLGALACFSLMLALADGPLAAAAFTCLYLFDNAMVAQIRAAHLDGFQVAAALAALALFVRAFQRGGRSAPGLDLGLAACCALATLVRANGVILVLLGAILVGRRFLVRCRRWPGRAVTRAVCEGAAMSLAFIATVLAVFAVHLMVSRSPPLYGSEAASQDVAFIGPAYDDYLNHRRPLSPAVIASAATGYGEAMAADFAGVARTDANGSPVWSWPMGGSTINYRWDAADGQVRYVQLIPNPVSWSLGLAALCGAGLLVLAPWPRTARRRRRVQLIASLLCVYAAFLGMSLGLESSRVLYLYHYFIGLILSFALAPLVFAEACARWSGLRKLQDVCLAAGAALVVAAFSFYAPLTFHKPLTWDQCEARNWPVEVVSCRQTP